MTKLGDLLYSSSAGSAPTQAQWQQLVQAMARGDAQAFHALIERSHRIVFTLIMRMVDDERTAEELTVQTFQRAWQEAAQYVPQGGSVLGWLMNLARAQTLKQLPRPSLRGLEYRQPLRAAVARLSREERQLFETVYFASRSIAEASSILGEPVEVVSSRLHIVMLKLSEALASKAP